MFGAQLILRTLLFGNPVAGYPSLMAVILFLGGTQLVTLGIIGEYLGRVFNETKRRPLYLVERYTPSRRHAPADRNRDADHVALAHDRGELLLAPAFGAGGTQRQHHPAIIRGRIDDADLHAVRQHGAPFREQAARIAHARGRDRRRT